MFLTRTSCCERTHASGYYLACPGQAVSVSVSPNNSTCAVGTGKVVIAPVCKYLIPPSQTGGDGRNQGSRDRSKTQPQPAYPPNPNAQGKEVEGREKQMPEGGGKTLQEPKHSKQQTGDRTGGAP